MSYYGPKPWVQRHWDWRAAGNFVFGGAGSGLLVAAALVLPLGPARTVSLPLGLALVGLGLFCVWLEIGRPLRALHVFFNPQTSWMTREAFAGVALFGITTYAFFSPGFLAEVAFGVAALAYCWCQGRILKASKGIPAWREPGIVPFIMATALTEGAALAAVLALAYGRQTKLIYGLLAAALLARAAAWVFYSAKVIPVLTGSPRAALENVTPVLLWFGTFGALALVAAASALPQAYALPLALVAALAAIGAGWQAKRTIVTRASLNQGFSLPKLPVRGTR
jgi:phenylacetyl-CoA:acceptor oxidoreductase subunit 2